MIKRNKDGSWGFDVYYYQNGERKRKKKASAKWKRKDAEKEQALFLASVGNKSSITYEELFELFLAYKKAQIKPSTLSIWTSTYKLHIKDYFGDTDVNKINNKMILSWQNSLMVKEHRGKPYSNRQLQKIQSQFKMVLLFGVRYDYLQSNPFRSDFATRIEYKKEMKIWTPNEFRQFISVADDVTYKAMFMLLYNGGLRRGEAIALKVSDYNGREVFVSKTYDSHNHIVTPPKTVNSNRSVLLDDATVNAIEDLIEFYKTLGVPRFNDLYLFGFYKPIPASTLERKKNQWCKKAGVKQIRIHDFRHSHASVLLANGVWTKEVAKRLGDTEEMVIRTYTHLLNEDQSSIVSLLNRMN